MKIIPPGMRHHFFITINQEETDSGFGEIVFKFDKYFCNIRKLLETRKFEKFNSFKNISISLIT